jgi:thioredoxin reductase
MDSTRREFIINASAAGLAAAIGTHSFPSNLFAQKKDSNMKSMKFFLDTHDRENKTFPQKISRQQFEQFYEKYKEACYAENVIPVRLHVGYNDGKAFCLTMAPDEEAVKRAHERTGLPYDSITEVEFATPGDTFFKLTR